MDLCSLYSVSDPERMPNKLFIHNMKMCKRCRLLSLKVCFWSWVGDVTWQDCSLCSVMGAPERTHSQNCWKEVRGIWNFCLTGGEWSSCKCQLVSTVFIDFCREYFSSILYLQLFFFILSGLTRTFFISLVLVCVFKVF